MSGTSPCRKDVEELVEFLCQGELAVDQAVRLEAILKEDSDARRYYIRYLHMHASLPLFSGCESGKQEMARLQEQLQLESCETSPGGVRCPVSSSEDAASASGLAGILGDCLRQGTVFLSRSSVFSILVAIGLPGFIFLVLILSLVNSRPEQPPMSVATIAQTCGCVGQMDTTNVPLSAGVALTEGQRLTLQSGLIEIAFDDGVTAILEAPAVFEVRRADGGFLQVGRLAANVPPRARGFRIETPLARVVDLGTEFGVSVAADGTTESHVFVGRVELATKSMPESPISTSNLLRGGQAARIRLTDANRMAARIEKIPASSDEFVRRFPAQAKGLAAGTASGLLASVDRRGGASGNRTPVGPFNGESNPLPSDGGGLRVGASLYSDRVFVIQQIDQPLVGAEYVRAFNTDKESNEFSYDVTFNTGLPEIYVMVLVDDRFEKVGRRRIGKQRVVVDAIVSQFAGPGEFVDTGYAVTSDDLGSSPRPLSAFGKVVPTKDASGKPIVYTFRAPPAGIRSITGYSQYVIAAMPKAPGT